MKGNHSCKPTNCLFIARPLMDTISKSPYSITDCRFPDRSRQGRSRILVENSTATVTSPARASRATKNTGSGSAASGRAEPMSTVAALRIWRVYRSLRRTAAVDPQMCVQHVETRQVGRRFVRRAVVLRRRHTPVTAPRQVRRSLVLRASGRGRPHGRSDPPPPPGRSATGSPARPDHPTTVPRRG